MSRHLRRPLLESFWVRVVHFADCRRDIVRCELTLSGHEPAHCILKSSTATGRPDQKPDQAVATDAQRCFFETSYNCLKIIERIGATGECKERHREPRNVPEIPSGSASHHI